MVFDFLALPREIQDVIYVIYFSQGRLILKGEAKQLGLRDIRLYRQRYNYRFTGIPSLAIELTCRKVYDDARKVRRECWTHCLIDPATAPNEPRKILESSPACEWLRENIISLEIQRLSEFSMYLHHAPCLTETISECSQLRYVDLQFWDHRMLDRMSLFALYRDDILMPVANEAHSNTGLKKIERVSMHALACHLQTKSGADWELKVKITIHYTVLETGEVYKVWSRSSLTRQFCQLLTSL